MLSKSKLEFLNCFLDDKGLIRVGGRLSHSNLIYDRKLPILLTARQELTRIYERIHIRELHVGPQALLYCKAIILAS